MKSTTNIMLEIKNANEVLAVKSISLQGKPVLVDAQDKVFYQLIDTATQEAPDAISLSRQGNNLEIRFENSEQVNLIIKNYYDFAGEKNNLIVGAWQNGQLYSYVPESGNPVEAMSVLSEEMTSTQVLGTQSFEKGFSLPSFSMPTFYPFWLFGLVPLAVITKAWVDDNKDKDSAEHVQENNSAQDNLSQVNIHLPDGLVEGTQLNITSNNTENHINQVINSDSIENHTLNVDLSKLVSDGATMKDLNVQLILGNDNERIVLDELLHPSLHNLSIDLAGGDDVLIYQNPDIHLTNILGGEGLDTLILDGENINLSTKIVKGFEKIELNKSAIFEVLNDEYFNDEVRDGPLKIVHGDDSKSVIDLGGHNQGDTHKINLESWSKINTQTEDNITYDVYQNANHTNSDDYIWIQQGILVI